MENYTKINHSVFSAKMPNIGSEFSDAFFSKYDEYDLAAYKNDVRLQGLRATWNEIEHYVLNVGSNNKFLSADKFAELYEIGLALQDKCNKKKNGQYYTPTDVAELMVNWFKGLRGTNICDVACGTGKLILTYLDSLEKQEAIKLIKDGRVYIYDSDDIALGICKTIMLVKYGKDLESYINILHGDFLSRKIALPADCKVISNPPYAKISALNDDWDKTETAVETKELYAMFMEKIVKQSVGSVIITPYSFVGGNKFYSLRKSLNAHSGFIISFDNVPGNIFSGKKYGIFNTNTANAVRASITVVENRKDRSGFRLSPLIRFKNEERKRLLVNDVIENFIYEKDQIISQEQNKYFKCDKRLGAIWDIWQTKSRTCVRDYISQEGEYILSMPSTCRYYTTAAKGAMNRNGQIILQIQDRDVFNYIYCMINSSFAYWYQRLFDGGFTYAKSLLSNMPLFYELLKEEDKRFFNDMATEMINVASCYVIRKNNVGVQENIKFPKEYRDRLNRRLMDILEIDVDEKVFDVVHSNMALEVSI